MDFKSSQTGKFEDANKKFSDSKNQNKEQSYFRNTEADIKGNYGYNIQKDRISDNISKTPFKENGKHKAALQQMAHNVQKKSDVNGNIPSKFIERSELLYEDAHELESSENIISKVDGETAVLLQHSVRKDRKAAHEFRQAEKTARKEIREIRGEERANTKFTESNIEFSDPTDKFDSKRIEPDIENSFKDSVQSFKSSDDRKNSDKVFDKQAISSVPVTKEIKKLVSQKEPEIKSESVENNTSIDKKKKKEIHFNESQVQFSDANDKFVNVADKMFRKEMTDYKGNSIFVNIPSKSATLAKTAAVSSGTILIQNKSHVPIRQNDPSSNENKGVSSETSKVKFADKMFRKEMTDYKGNSIFVNIPSKSATLAKTAAVSSGTILIQNKSHVPIRQNDPSSNENKGVSSETSKVKFAENVPETNKSVASYFSETQTDRSSDNYSSKEIRSMKTSNTLKDVSGDGEKFMTKEERLDQAEVKRKEAKSGKNKARRKAASKAAFANVLMTKKNMQNNMENMTGEVSGDLIADGSGGILQTIQGNTQSILTRAGAAIGDKALEVLEFMAAGIARAMKAFAALMAPMFGVLMIPLIIIVVLFMLMASGDLGEEYDIEASGDGYVYSYLSEDEIDNIIDSLYDTYNNPDLGIYNMGPTQETVLRYALSKVGCPYDQNYHGNVTANIFDCSSLAFRSYKEVKINISHEGSYSAAEECHNMVYRKKVVPSGEELLPGDLIFYGGSSNGRFMGIYHVGIYVGNGKMVEAKGKKRGVIYGDIRTDDVVSIGRPWK